MSVIVLYGQKSDRQPVDDEDVPFEEGTSCDGTLQLNVGDGTWTAEEQSSFHFMHGSGCFSSESSGTFSVKGEKVLLTVTQHSPMNTDRRAPNPREVGKVIEVSLKNIKDGVPITSPFECCDALTIQSGAEHLEKLLAQ